MSDTGFYQTAAWILFAFMCGVVAGGYLALRLRTGQPPRATRDACLALRGDAATLT